MLPRMPPLTPSTSSRLPSLGYLGITPIEVEADIDIEGEARAAMAAQLADHEMIRKLLVDLTPLLLVESKTRQVSEKMATGFRRKMEVHAASEEQVWFPALHALAVLRSTSIPLRKVDGAIQHAVAEHHKEVAAAVATLEQRMAKRGTEKLAWDLAIRTILGHFLEEERDILGVLFPSTVANAVEATLSPVDVTFTRAVALAKAQLRAQSSFPLSLSLKWFLVLYAEAVNAHDEAEELRKEFSFDRAGRPPPWLVAIVNETATSLQWDADISGLRGELGLLDARAPVVPAAPAPVAPPVQAARGPKRSTWISPSYGSVRVEAPNDKGWGSISGTVGSKRMRFGWSAIEHRWARGEVPPANLLEEVHAEGWIELGGSTAGAAPVSAPSSPAVPPSAPRPRRPEAPELSMEKVIPEPGDLVVRHSGGTKSNAFSVDLFKGYEKRGMAQRYKGEGLLWSTVYGGDRVIHAMRGKKTDIEAEAQEPEEQTGPPPPDTVPATDFTWAVLSGRRGDKYGWGGALVRYYLDKLGIPYDPNARILRGDLGSYAHDYYDITAPGIIYPGAEAFAVADRGDKTIKPVPGDTAVEGTGRNLRFKVVNSKGRLEYGYPFTNETEDGVTGIKFEPSFSRSGIDSVYRLVEQWQRKTDPHAYGDFWHMNIRKPAFVIYDGLTEANLRKYGRRLLEGIDAVVRPHVVSVVETQTRGDIPVEVIREHLPPLPSGRILHRPSSGKPWEDVTQGTEAGRPPLPRGRAAPVERFRPEKFDDLADRMEDAIRKKEDPAIGRQNVTRRRAGIAAGMADEARALRRVQATLRELAAVARAQGDAFPAVLKGIGNRTELELLIRAWKGVERDVEYAVSRRGDDWEQVKELGNKFLEGTWNLQNGILNFRSLRMPDKILVEHWRSMEKYAEREGWASSVAGRTLLKWIKGATQYKSNEEYVSAPPDAVLDAMDKAKAAHPGAFRWDYWTAEAQQSARRLRRMGIDSPEKWIEALRAFRPIYLASDPYRSGRIDPEVARRKARMKEIQREMIGDKSLDFIPTPPELAREVIGRAGISDLPAGARVLEPSAGMGALADAAVEANPEACLDLLELSPRRREYLELQGYPCMELHGQDFMDYRPGPVYDAIVMNPPFSDSQDAAHIRHAYDLLKPGATLVALMSEGPFFRSYKKDAEWRTWFEAVGGESEKLEEGVFNAASNLTRSGVNGRMVWITKP